MNIWQWVGETERELRAQGHGRLAELLDELPSAVCNDRHEQVDALVPEAISLARGLELPWVELFVRHWSLQSRVLHRMDAKALGDALALLDFAHTDATRDCPQAVCTVQDLSACYEQVDDVGYAAERVAVAEEALARIDPSWPCFECISEELASALAAQGKHEESLAFLVAQERAAKGARGAGPLALAPFSGRFGTRASALMALGRHEEALALVRERSTGLTDRERRELSAIYESLALAGLGRTAEAARVLTRVPDPLHIPSHYTRWAEVAEKLVAAGELANDVPFGQVLQAMLARLDRQGVGHTLVRLAARAGRLAVARGSAPLAASALATMERAAARLVRPSDAEPSLTALREALAGLRLAARELPETPEALLASLGPLRDEALDASYGLLDAATERWPEHEGLVVLFSKVASRLGVGDVARARLGAYCAAFPRAVEALVALGVAELGVRDLAAFHDVIARLRALGEDDGADWLTAVGGLDRGELAAARTAAEALAARHPRDLQARRLALQAARGQRDFEAMLRWSRELVALGEAAGPADWSRMVAGSALGAWDDVRDSAARLGFETPGEGPIEVNAGACRVRFVADTEQASAELFAVRTGPVTARILEIEGSSEEERYGDVVVFDPEPLPAHDAPPSGERPPLRVFSVLTTIARGDHRGFALDGLHPGEDLVQRLRRALAADGLVLQVHSGSGYELPGESDDAPRRPGIYAYLAVPRARSLAEVSRRLAELTDGLELTWLGLAREAGDEVLVAAHEERATRLGL